MLRCAPAWLRLLLALSACLHLRWGVALTCCAPMLTSKPTPPQHQHQARRPPPLRPALPPIVQLATVEPLTGEQAAATPEQAAEDAERRRRAGEQLSELRRVVAAVLEDRAAARGGAEGMCGGELESLGSADMAEVPDEFLDPILMTIMTVRTPGSLALLPFGGWHDWRT